MKLHDFDATCFSQDETQKSDGTEHHSVAEIKSTK